jgi:hypothetical protein
MRSTSGFFLILIVLPFLVVGCGGSQTPEAVKDDADKAFQSNNYEDAMKLYDQLLDWKGEGAPSKAILFESTLNIIRCKILKQDFDGAFASLEKMQTDFSESLTVKDYATVIRAFLAQNAIDQTIAAMGIVGQLHPEKKDELKPYIEKIKKQGATPEQLKKLMDLGYL